LPKVTVILTSFNHERYIREAIDSVLTQTFTDFELVIWDDESSDGSWGIINEYSDPRVRSFRNKKRVGSIFGINETIANHNSGKYIAIHHSDDVWESDKLEKQVGFLDAHEHIGAVFSNASIIADDGSPFSLDSHFYYNVFDQENKNRHEWLNYFFFHGNVLCHPSVLIRKACYDDVGSYRHGIYQLCDFDMWIRLCLKYEIHILPDRLIRFRARDNEENSSGDRPDSRIRSTYEFYKLIQNYKKVLDFADLEKIFPSAKKFFRKESTDVEFALGMIALEHAEIPVAPLLGLDIFFDALSDPKRRIALKQNYNFGQVELMEITGQNDVFSREKVERLQKGLNHISAERDEQVTRLSHALAERNEQATSLSHALAERDGQVASLSHALAERDGQVAGLSHALAERDGQVAGLSHALAERDGQVAGLSHALAERDGQVARLSHALAERDGRVASLSHALAERDGQVANLSRAVAERDGTVTGLSGLIAERDGRVADLNASIQEIYKSRSWRMTAPVRWMTSTFLK
jgi:glycosyltransferase involved in cell wall biosynthesis